MCKRLENEGRLTSVLREVRVGNYRKMHIALLTLFELKLDLATCTADELERVPGIGPKTARFFLLWSRPTIRHAALDVHILKWLRKLGHENVPVQTPQDRKVYKRLEDTFLAEADKRGIEPARLDKQVWLSYRVERGHHASQDA